MLFRIANREDSSVQNFRTSIIFNDELIKNSVFFRVDSED